MLKNYKERYKESRVQGVQVNHKFLKTLDSGLAAIPDHDPGRNDGKWHFSTFYEFILFKYIQNNSKIPKGRKTWSNFTDKKIGCVCSFP